MLLHDDDKDFKKSYLITNGQKVVQQFILRKWNPREGKVSIQRLSFLVMQSITSFPEKAQMSLYVQSLVLRAFQRRTITFRLFYHFQQSPFIYNQKHERPLPTAMMIKKILHNSQLSNLLLPSNRQIDIELTKNWNAILYSICRFSFPYLKRCESKREKFISEMRFNFCLQQFVIHNNLALFDWLISEI